MIPLTRKPFSLLSVLPAILTAPLLAISLSWSPNVTASPTASTTAEIPTAPAAEAIASVQGLQVTDALTVPSLPDMVVQAGLDTIGTRYRWGGDDPVDGFDCSGLTQFVFREIAGMDLPRTAREQRQEGTGIKKTELQPGDLVFFSTMRRRGVSHVGIYIGEDQFVHAPTRGGKVRVDSLDSSYWSRSYVAARRFIEPSRETPMPGLRLLADASAGR